ncbi:DsbA family protein [Shewanella schlegeliana]|uniref:DsbA family protein n=1 Tax=Shewanella schlegeliana TaxID=190308 RepID=A0ABS1T286_9GAMM|nr:DsbA family protein [Shewanella schlegeliana]MBL4914909.1 DsbA family protein [Shewanella schlegeliana]MCL1110400.1 DsbA family protein [Shewanella schlegeliana]GIU27832.1 DsbA family protein [Shewanella schlegeliana]
MNLAILYYVYDPMCSWCWGYRPTWSALQSELQRSYPELSIEYKLGGLAPDSDEPMPDEMQQLLQQTWNKISEQLGTQFNFDFWHHCQPRRSTYPACRAALLARDVGLEQEMTLAIQQAYYLEAKNPSDNVTLIELAVGLGLDEALFSKALLSESTKAKLEEEVCRTRHLPIQGFPSLVLLVNGEFYLIELDYQNWQTSFQQIASLLSE